MKKTIIKHGVVLLFGFLLLVGNSMAADLVVFSGAGLMKPMEEMRQNFEVRENITVNAHYGSSGEIFAMVSAGQPCDVLIPGAEKYTEDALKNGWVLEDTIRKAVLHVPTIVVPKGNPAHINAIEDLAKPGVKVAIGDPKAPAIGRVAKKIFMKNGLWDKVEPNIEVYAPTVNQLLIYVALEQVDAAIIWSDLTTWAEGKGKLEVVPISSKQNLIMTIPTAVCTKAPHMDKARAFNAYVTSPEGLAIWKKWGFDPVQKLNFFRIIFLTLTLLVTAILVLAISSLILVPSWEDIRQNIVSPEMRFSLKLSLTTGLISTALVMLFAVPIGYTLSRFQFPGKGFIKSIIDLPVAFPELVLGLCLLLVFGSSSLGKALSAVGLTFVFTKKGIVIAQFFTALPYAGRILKSTFDYINPRMEFVSRSLGYSMFETFLNVSLPLAKNGILAAVVISFARCIGTFGTVLILAGGSYMKTEVLPITLYLNISYGNMGMALTSGIVLMVVSFAAIVIFEMTEARL